MTITEELALALRAMPCRCQRAKEWSKSENGELERKVVARCSRCTALERYDLEFMPLRSEEIVQ